MNRAAGEHGPDQDGDRSVSVVALSQGFDAVYGLELIGPGDGEPGGDQGGEVGGGEGGGEGTTLRGRVRVRRELLGAGGRLHGGVPAAIAESLASHGTGSVTWAHGLAASGLSNDTTVVAPVVEGATLHAEATAQSRADDLWVWSVALRDDAGTLCAFSRVTIAVRPLRR